MGLEAIICIIILRADFAGHEIKRSVFFTCSEVNTDWLTACHPAIYCRKLSTFTAELQSSGL